MRFEYRLMREWPLLAWLAKLEPQGQVIHVTHGPQVETRPDWFCEAVWDGDFEQGAFDETDLVFGSGARLRGDGRRAVLVSSGTCVDRLQSLRTDDGATYVSNSLPCLLAAADLAIPATDGMAWKRFVSIIKGLDRYERQIETTGAPVRLTYFHNLTWNGQWLHETEKPDTADDGFHGFDQYRGFLQSALARIAANGSDAGRGHRYGITASVSSGYDSPTVATLAREVGLRDTFTFNEARAGKADSGEAIVKALGLNITVLPRERWRERELAEVPFIACDAKGEDVFFRAAEDFLPGKLLLTGFHGDKIWDRDNPKPGPYIERGDRSGLSMSEYRLWMGYIHCAVPFMGVRHAADVKAISRGADMAAWDVGGTYTRPICRRITETAGVPRELFGQLKKGSSLEWSARRRQQSESTLADFHGWLREHAGQFVRAGRVPPHLRESVYRPGQWLATGVGWRLHERLKHLPGPLKVAGNVSRDVARFGQRDLVSHYMFPWAVDRAKRRYPKPAQPAPEPARRAGAALADPASVQLPNASPVA